MSNNLTETRKKKIIECHDQIHKTMREALDYALEAGRLLTEQKAEMEHGEFLPWIEKNLPFSQRTAYNYIKLFDYSDKIATVTNLQEAYQQIETIEVHEKQKERTAQKARVTQFVKTGTKPAGWKRGTDDKVLERTKTADTIPGEFETDEDISPNLGDGFDDVEQVQPTDPNDALDDILNYLGQVLDEIPAISDKHFICNSVIKFMKKKSIDFDRQASETEQDELNDLINFDALREPVSVPDELEIF